MQNSNLIKSYLEGLYKNAHKPLPTIVSETYGEILYESVEKLFAHLNLTEQDIFFDLGSGVGKLAIHFFLRSTIQEAVGIEISTVLHQQALQAVDKMTNELSIFFEPQRKLTFLQGDFLKIPLTSATVIFICAPCYTQPMMNQLGNIINETPSIRKVLSLRPLNTLHRLPLKKILRVEGTWDSALCYLYLS